MINKISYLNKESRLATPQKTEKNKNSTNVIMQTSVPISKYSSANIAANYLPFKDGRVISFKGDAASVDYFNTACKEHLGLAESPIMTTNVVKGNYYTKTVDNLAIAMGPGQDVVLMLPDEDTNPEVLISQFRKQLKNGNYQGQGLTPDYEIAYMDLKADKAKDLTYFNRYIATQDPNKKQILFINGMENLFKDEKAGSDFRYHKQANGAIKVIGIIPENLLNPPPAKPGEEINTASDKIAKNLAIATKDMVKIDMGHLTAADTKRFFKENPQYITNVFDKYKNVELSMSPTAVDETVNRVVALEGDLISKTLKIVDFMSAAKANDALKHKRTKAIINTDWVKKFFSEFDKIIDSLRTKNKGRFRILENVDTKLKDVGGISDVKEDFEEVISFLKNPKQYRKEHNGRGIKGLLLTGDPGTGKTLTARAIAGESEVPCFHLSASELVEMYAGVGAARVREVFKRAKEFPAAIIFIDEIDAIGKKRAGNASGGSDEREATLNQILVEMDGIDEKDGKHNVVVIGATNRKDILDSALLRKGRFDLDIKMPNPRTNMDRLEILQLASKNIKFENDVEKNKIMDEAAKMAKGMNGADLVRMMDVAQNHSLKRQTNKIVTLDDVTEGYLQVIQGPVSKIADETPIGEMASTIKHEYSHALITDFFNSLPDTAEISFITLDRRGDYLGMLHTNRPNVNTNFKSVMFANAISYAGGMGEPQFKNIGHDAGASGDLRNITELIRKVITDCHLGIYTMPLAMSAPEGVDPGFYETLRKINESNIEKDVRLFTEIPIKLAQTVINFHKGSEEEYLAMFIDHAGKGGSVFSGENFKKFINDWLVRNKKVESSRVLLNALDALVDISHNSKKLIEGSNGSVNMNNILNQRIDSIIDEIQSESWYKMTTEARVSASELLIKKVKAIVHLAQDSTELLDKTTNVKYTKDAMKIVNKMIDNICQADKKSIFKKFAKNVMAAA